MRNKKGFTLIELLVVIAIIAILAAILFPVFSKAREKARQASCLSNIKQQALGVTMYMEDYDEYFPPKYMQGLPGGKNGDDISWWSDLIQPYLANYQIMACPSFTSPYGANGVATTFNNGYTASAYVFSGYYSKGYPAGSFSAESSVVNPSNCYMIFDGAGPFMGEFYCMNPEINTNMAEPVYMYLPGSYALAMAAGYTNPTSIAQLLASPCANDFKNGRHNGGINMAFVDGHAKWLPTAAPFSASVQLTKNYFAYYAKGLPYPTGLNNPWCPNGNNPTY